MTQLITARSLTRYADTLAESSSFGLESSFGRPKNEVFSGTRGTTNFFHEDDPQGATRSATELVMLTNVDETVPQARARTRRELAITIETWTNRSGPARRRTWARWVTHYPSLNGIDPTAMWDTTNHDHDAALVDLLRLAQSEPDAFIAWLCKSRYLISNKIRTTIPADLTELAAAALSADLDELATRRRPFSTLYNRARRQCRKSLIPTVASSQPLTMGKGLSSNHSDPALRSKSRTVVYAPFAVSEPTESIDTMVSVDGVCRRHSETRWTQLLAETLLDQPTLSERTRRRTRATYRTLIRGAA